MNIRAYEEGDLPEVLAIISSILTEYGFSPDLGGVRRDLSRAGSVYAPPRGGLWVADAGGEVLGTVAVRPKEPGTCELKRLYVRPGRRGKGLGQTLYAHAEAFARSAGYDRIWLDSSRRFREARRLYERNGFVLLEELQNEWEDNVYEKRLT